MTAYHQSIIDRETSNEQMVFGEHVCLQRRAACSRDATDYVQFDFAYSGTSYVYDYVTQIPTLLTKTGVVRFVADKAQLDSNGYELEFNPMFSIAQFSLSNASIFVSARGASPDFYNVAFNLTIPTGSDPYHLDLDGNALATSSFTIVPLPNGNNANTYGRVTAVKSQVLQLDVAPTLGLSFVDGVPEPATWAMMVGGFGLVGAAMRRHRTSVRFA